MRISGGAQAVLGQFPYQVRIIGEINEANYLVCGGIVISRDYILTAVHCTKTIVKFELGLGSISFFEPQIVINTTLKLEHPDYNPLYLNNDIALLGLPTRLEFSDTIAPALLPRKSQENQLFVNELAVISGFGASQAGGGISQRLNYANVRVIYNSECEIFYGSDVIKVSSMCTRGAISSTDNGCTGDSGGPLVLENDRTIIGILSFLSSRGCSAGDPAGYTRVTSFLDWITRNTGIELRP